jgi:hypothetical protein
MFRDLLGGSFEMPILHDTVGQVVEERIAPRSSVRTTPGTIRDRIEERRPLGAGISVSLGDVHEGLLQMNRDGTMHGAIE